MIDYVDDVIDDYDYDVIDDYECNHLEDQLLQSSSSLSSSPVRC